VVRCAQKATLGPVCRLSCSLTCSGLAGLGKQSLLLLHGCLQPCRQLREFQAFRNSLVFLLVAQSNWLGHRHAYNLRRRAGCSQGRAGQGE